MTTATDTSRVLVVVDEPTLANVLRDVLSMEGSHVRTAALRAEPWRGIGSLFGDSYVGLLRGMRGDRRDRFKCDNRRSFS